MKSKLEKINSKKFENYSIEADQLAGVIGGTFTTICTTRLNGQKAFDTFDDASKITSGPLAGGWEGKDLHSEVRGDNSCPQ